MEQTTFAELLEKHQALNRLLIELGQMIREFRGVKPWDVPPKEEELENDSRPVIQSLYGKMKEIRTELRDLDQLELGILASPTPRGSVNA